MERFYMLQNQKLISETPLTSAIHYTKTLALDFQKTYHIDVMNVLFITDGGCTQSIIAETYTDKVSRLMLQKCKNHLGREDSVAPLIKILRHRTKANVWVYDIVPKLDTAMQFEKECGGTTGTYRIRMDVLTSPNLFIDDFINKISEHGARLDTQG